MPETGFKPADDWAAFTGAKRRITVAYYNPASDGFGTAVEAKGSKDGSRIEQRGDVTVTLATWWVQGLTSRPVVGSRIRCRDDYWYIEGEVADPDGKVYECRCVLGSA